MHDDGTCQGLRNRWGTKASARQTAAARIDALGAAFNTAHNKVGQLKVDLEDAKNQLRLHPGDYSKRERVGEIEASLSVAQGEQDAARTAKEQAQRELDSLTDELSELAADLLTNCPQRYHPA